ncbi:unnamed protein product, partial [Nesidiocoris tenuis]
AYLPLKQGRQIHNPNRSQTHNQIRSETHNETETQTHNRNRTQEKNRRIKRGAGRSREKGRWPINQLQSSVGRPVVTAPRTGTIKPVIRRSPRYRELEMFRRLTIRRLFCSPPFPATFPRGPRLIETLWN